MCQGCVCGFTRGKTYIFLVLPGNIHPHPGRDLGPFPRDYPPGDMVTVTLFLIAPRAVTFSQRSQAGWSVGIIMTKFFILKEYEAQRRERNHPQSFSKSVVGPVYCFHSQGVPPLLPSSCKPHPDLTVYPSQHHTRLFFHSPPDPRKTLKGKFALRFNN